MARIRSIKPDFFLDPDLSELSHESRLAFIGLWCHADKAGRLEDEPKKLKVLIFPYEKADMNAILDTLTKKPFIVRYASNDHNYIQIVNFHKHQRPHHTEKASELPECNGILTVKEPLLDGDKKVGKEEGKERKGECPKDILEFMSYFNLKTQKNLKINAARKKIIESRLTEYTLEQLKQAVDNFALDDWPDRAKYTDIVYCIGIRSNIDNLEKWLNHKPKQQAWAKP